MNEVNREAEKKPYRVTLRSVVNIIVYVDATTVDEARAKAFNWTGDYPEGSSTVGDYYLDEDLLFDDGEMDWQITNIENEDFVEVLELETDGPNENAAETA